METLYKNHILVIAGQSPADVRLSERPVKVYMVANLAFSETPEISAEHYSISLGAVYAAMSFYEDNREGIKQALQDAEEIDLGEMDVTSKQIDEIRQRVNQLKNK